MSDEIHTVDDYDDLVAVDRISERQRTQIASTLSDGATAVVWLPEWLVKEGDKDIVPLHAHPQLYAGAVMDYSDRAFHVAQPEGTAAYVPKSEAEVFRLAEGVDHVETPQTGLGSFGVE